MNPLRQAIRFGLATALPRHRLLVLGPRRGSAPAAAREGQATPAGIVLPEIALTFDDGPHPEHTPRVLDALAAYGLRGTFFVIGAQAEQHPGLIRRIVLEGHTLGNHTWTHSEPAQTSASLFLEEIHRTGQLLEDLTGRPCRLVRPPKGKVTARKLLGLWRKQQTVALWNVDPRDYRMQAASEVTRWLDRQAWSQGDVLLLHDNRPWAAMAAAQIGRRGDARTVSLAEWLRPAGATPAVGLLEGTQPESSSTTTWSSSANTRHAEQGLPRVTATGHSQPVAPARLMTSSSMRGSS